MPKLFSLTFLLSIIFSNFSAYSCEILEDKNSLQVLTPALSERKTAKLRLSNGLEAYIVSDPGANNSACALCVGVGSWQEGDDHEGLAHFCEHMLFMGSSKYPDENCFSKKIADNGGITNAYTAGHCTNYMFSTSHSSFNEILDIFAQFFISPLFKQAAVEREMLAVHQEYENATRNDAFREWMVFKETSSPHHPISHFDCGTEHTLKKIPLSHLRDFHSKYYSANKMHLAIYTNQDIESISQFVKETFSLIPTVSSPSQNHEKILSPTQKGHITYIKPLKEIRKISFCWEMPKEYATDMHGKIPDLIAYALSYKGERTIFAKLKEKHLVENISAECETLSKDEMLLSLTIYLTKEGLTSLDEVIATTFTGINKLKEEGIPLCVFEECKKMSELEYEWQSRPNEFYYVQQLASAMIREKLETFPLKTVSFSSYKPLQTKELLKKLTPEETAFFVVANPDITGQIPDKKEKWMGAEYISVKLEEEKLSLWEKLKSEEGSFLTPNKFIPTNVTLLSNGQGKEEFEPELLIDEPQGKCYFLKDSFYLVPKVSIDLGIKSPLIDATQKSVSLTDLFTLDLDHKLAPLFSSAERGGLSGNIYQKDLKFHISIAGYNEKCTLLLTSILTAMKESKTSKQEFELYKDYLLKSYANREKNLSIQQGKEMLLSILFNNSHIGIDLARQLETITYEDYLSFKQNLFNQAYFEMMVYGNIDSEHTKGLWKELKTTFNASLFVSNDHHKKKVFPFHETKKPMTLALENSLGGDATVLCIGFGKQTYEKLAAQKILNQVISEAFFDTLRTKQQTGYMAYSLPFASDGLLIQLFAVHSTTHYSEELLARFELFIEDFNRNLKENIPSERFELIKATIIEKLENPPQNLDNKANELVYLAFSEEGNFFKRQKLIGATKDLSYDDFIAISSSSLSRKNNQRIAVLVSGGDNKSFSYVKSSPEILKQLQF